MVFLLVLLLLLLEYVTDKHFSCVITNGNKHLSEDKVAKQREIQNCRLRPSCFTKHTLCWFKFLSGLGCCGTLVKNMQRSYLTPDLPKLTTLTTDLQMIYPLLKLFLCSVEDKLYETLLPMSIKDDITSR